MCDSSSLKRAALRILAAVFIVALIAYSVIWMYYIRWHMTAELGVVSPPNPPLAQYITVEKVVALSPAERAGFLQGDQIVRANGRSVHSLSDPEALARGKPGDVVTFEVKRAGLTAPTTLIATLGPTRGGSPRPWDVELANSFPVLFVIVAIPILFLRFDDHNVWLLAFVFAGFVAAAPIGFREGAIHPALRGFALAYMFAFYGSSPALFYFFCTVFPNSSPLDRRLPYLKHVLLIIAGGTSVSIAAAVLIRGSLAPAISVAQLWPGLIPVVVAYMFCGFLLGLMALVWNSISSTGVVTRRKTRVMVWGTVGAFAPGMVLTLFAFVRRQGLYTLPFWVWITPILMLSLMPLAFAYAVVKHRVLEVPLLLKRSARYFLAQRGFMALIVGAGVVATIFLARQLERS